VHAWAVVRAAALELRTAGGAHGGRPRWRSARRGRRAWRATAPDGRDGGPRASRLGSLPYSSQARRDGSSLASWPRPRSAQDLAEGGRNQSVSTLGGSAGMEAGSARLARGGGREEEALLRPTVGEVSLWVPDLFTVYDLNR